MVFLRKLAKNNKRYANIIIIGLVEVIMRKRRQYNE